MIAHYCFLYIYLKYKKHFLKVIKIAIFHSKSHYVPFGWNETVQIRSNRFIYHEMDRNISFIIYIYVYNSHHTGHDFLSSIFTEHIYLSNSQFMVCSLHNNRTVLKCKRTWLGFHEYAENAWKTGWNGTHKEAWLSLGEMRRSATLLTLENYKSASKKHTAINAGSECRRPPNW